MRVIARIIATSSPSSRGTSPTSTATTNANSGTNTASATASGSGGSEVVWVSPEAPKHLFDRDGVVIELLGLCA